MARQYEDIINYIVEKTGLNISDATVMVNLVYDATADYIAKCNTFIIRGKFSIKPYPQKALTYTYKGDKYYYPDTFKLKINMSKGFKKEILKNVSEDKETQCRLHSLMKKKQ